MLRWHSKVTFWSHKSHERLHLERYSETPQNFSYYHAILVLDLPSYSFHQKVEHREETGGNIPAMPLPSTVSSALASWGNYWLQERINHTRCNFQVLQHRSFNQCWYPDQSQYPWLQTDHPWSLRDTSSYACTYSTPKSRSATTPGEDLRFHRHNVYCMLEPYWLLLINLYMCTWNVCFQHCLYKMGNPHFIC